MKPTTLRFSLQRLFLLALISFVAVAAMLAIAASANRANRSAKVRASQAANTKSAVNPDFQKGKQPNAPNAAVITATVTDNVTAATKIAPGANINYTAVVTNNGAASPADDATNLNFSDPLDANTTLVAGSVHASPIAFNDTYNWVGNTFLDTAARSLPAVTANDVAVNPPGGTDTFTVTAIAGGATALGGSVTLTSPSGAFTYTPPLGRPNLADGATVQDSFTYTITSSADPTLTSVGTVRINLTGRVWYLQAGAAGDGRSNTPSGSPAAMSTAADKSSDIFYIFSNGANLNGPFSVDAGQQLLGQGVNLVVNAITLFTAGAAPTTTNTAGSCVALAGAPGNNTLSGFNIGNCTGGTAITGANVGTLNVSTMSINTNGGALDLTGVGSPTVSVVLGGTTSTGGTKNINLVGLNGTVTLAGGALSGASNNAFDVTGAGTANISYTGTITNTAAARLINVSGKTGGTIALSGAVSGTGSSTGINLTTNTGTTINFTGGITLNAATAGFIATGGGTVSATQNNTSIVNTITTTTGTALNVSNTTIGATGLTFRSISAGTGAGSAGNGIILDTTGASGGLTVTGNGGVCAFANPTCDGGTIQHKTGADSASTYTSGLGIYLNNTQSVSLTRMRFHDFDNGGIRGRTVNGFILQTSVVDGTNGTCNSASCDVDINNGEDSVRFTNLTGSALIDSCFIGGGFADNVRVVNNSGTLNRLTVSNSTIGVLGGNRGLATNAQGGQDDVNFEAKDGIAVMNVTVSNNTLNYGVGDIVQASNNDNTAPIGTMDVVVRGNTIVNSNAADQVIGASGITIAGLGTTTYEVACNKVANSKGIDVNLFKGHEPLAGGIAANFSGTVFNNTIGLVGVAHSGGGAGATALNVDMQGRGSHTVLIKNNVIRQYGEAGIRLNNVDNNSTAATLNATVIGNTTIGVDSDAFTGIFVVAGAASGTDSSNITNLKLGGAGAEQNNFTQGDPANGSDVFLQHGVAASTFNLSKAASASNTPSQIVIDNNVSAGLTVFTDAGILAVNTVPALPAAINETCSPPPIPNPVDETGRNQPGLSDVPATASSSKLAVVAPQQTAQLAETPVSALPLKQVGPTVNSSSAIGKAIPKATAAEVARIYQSERPLSNHAVRRFNALSQDPNAPTSGEVVSLNTIATFPAGGTSITIKYSATVNSPPLARQVSTQATVTANAGAISVTSTDPGPPVVNGPTVTLVDTLMTWNGATSTDWNTATNWTQPAGGTQYAPGVSNPAVNDVVIPNVGAQPAITATDIGIYSLNLSNGRTLTITNPRVLTIGGSPGGDLTLDGIISGGNLNLGTGTHVINNAGGTGSLTSTNVATVLSGGTVTLNNNLQAGALAVNAGGSMNITNRTLSLNGSGAALTIPGGATFTTTGSTVIFNGTAAQQAAGIAYNNLTINNTIGTNVTGVTLTGNATVNGTLALTSSDLATGAFTLTQPNTTASTGVSDVIGSVIRTGGPFPAATALTFGNPNNRITFATAVTNPTTVTVVLAKVPPATYTAAVQRNYTISTTGSNTSTATLRLRYLDSEVTGLNTEATLHLRRLRTGDGHWVAQIPDSVDTTNNFVETTGSTVVGTNLPTQWTFSSLAPTASGSTVTGRITDNQGNPVEGAVVRLQGTQNRKFITDANGFYRFDNVEAAGLYTVTPSRVNYTFSPATRSFSLIGETIEATFGATVATSNLQNPLDTPEYFVRQNYIDFLGREPDEAGFNFWSDQILECGADTTCIDRRRENGSAAFFLSIEFRETGGLVDGLYRAGYGTSPQYSAFMPDARTVGLGVRVGDDGWQAKLEANKAAFVNAFANRPAFHQMYDSMDNSLFVDTLIQHTGVSFTAGERDALVTGLGAGTMTRGEALRSIAENQNFVNAKFNQAFVMMEYFGYLRRDADSGGYAFWLNKLNEFNGNFEQAEMVKAFIVSGEYRDRFPR